MARGTLPLLGRTIRRRTLPSRCGIGRSAFSRGCTVRGGFGARRGIGPCTLCLGCFSGARTAIAPPSGRVGMLLDIAVRAVVFLNARADSRRRLLRFSLFRNRTFGYHSGRALLSGRPIVFGSHCGSGAPAGSGAFPVVLRGANPSICCCSASALRGRRIPRLILYARIGAFALRCFQDAPIGQGLDPLLRPSPLPGHLPLGSGWKSRNYGICDSMELFLAS